MRELLADAAQRLAAAGIDDPEHDARRLACWAGECTPSELAIRGAGLSSDPEFTPRFQEAVERRAKREPLQWIEGEAAFLDFAVAIGEGALVPRPETETTASVAIEHAPSRGRVLDAGTGSGVLAIALARAHTGAEIHATERSIPALVWAGKNKERLAPQVHLHEGWFLGVPESAGPFDLIVSNPPYIPAADWDGLDPEVRDHDPRVALVPAGGRAEDGLADVRLLLTEAPAHLAPGGTFVCEIGHDQGPAAAEAAAKAAWTNVEIRPDLAGRDRVLVARRPPVPASTIHGKAATDTGTAADSHDRPGDSQ